MTVNRWRDHLDDRGQMAGIEAVPFGFLIFVAGALLLANAWAVVDAKMAVTAAAREAARAYVEAPDASSAELRSVSAGRAAISGHGRDADQLTISLDGVGFSRCAPVTAEASLAIPSINLPFIGGFGRTFEVRATHTEIVDPYRSGLDGPAGC